VPLHMPATEQAAVAGGSVVEEVHRSAPSTTHDPEEAKPSATGDDADVTTFPLKLLSFLQNKDFEDVMWWFPTGDAFCVVPKEFSERVLEKHFQGTKFESFTRKLNRWGFKKIGHPDVAPEAMAYQHELFHRDKPELVRTMTGGKKKGMTKGSSPKDTALGQVNGEEQSLYDAGSAGFSLLSSSSLLSPHYGQLPVQQPNHLQSHMNAQLREELSRMTSEQSVRAAAGRMAAAQQGQLLGVSPHSDSIRIRLIQELQQQMVHEQQMGRGSTLPSGGINGSTQTSASLGVANNQQELDRRLLELYLLQEQQKRLSQQGQNGSGV
jgi:hypothetical protein